MQCTAALYPSLSCRFRQRDDQHQRESRCALAIVILLNSFQRCMSGLLHQLEKKKQPPVTAGQAWVCFVISPSSDLLKSCGSRMMLETPTMESNLCFLFTYLFIHLFCNCIHRFFLRLLCVEVHVIMIDLLMNTVVCGCGCGCPNMSRMCIILFLRQMFPQHSVFYFCLGANKSSYMKLAVDTNINNIRYHVNILQHSFTHP